MRVALAAFALVPLLSAGCFTFDGETHYVYGSNLDVPGNNLLIWPIDETGNAFRRTTQLSEGLHMRSEGHVFTMPHTGDWRLAGKVDLAGVVVLLPPKPGRELNERALEIGDGVSRAYPGASVHLIRMRVVPYGIESVGQLEALLRNEWHEHMGTRPGFISDVVVSSLRRDAGALSIAELVVVPLDGETVHYAVGTPSPEGAELGLTIREATADDLVQVVLELAGEGRAARAAKAESGEDSPLAGVGIRTGRVRAILPAGSPEEVRRTLEGLLLELQRSPFFGPEVAGESYFPRNVAPWSGLEGLELRYATSMKWGELKAVADFRENGLPWLLLYFSS